MKSNSGIIGPKQTSSTGSTGIASGEYGTFEQYNRIKNDRWPEVPPDTISLVYTTGSKPTWMTLRTKHATNTGFDSSGFWINGNASSTSNSYPIITNQSFPASHTSLTMKFVVVKNETCADHGICIFRNGGSPKWDWGVDSTRIAMQWNCSNPNWYPASGSGTGNMSGASTNTTYYVSIVMNLATGYTSTVMRTGSFTGSVVINDARTMTGNKLDQISGWTSTSTWDIGFDADQDTTSYKSYFKNIDIEVS